MRGLGNKLQSRSSGAQGILTMWIIDYRCGAQTWLDMSHLENKTIKEFNLKMKCCRIGGIKAPQTIKQNKTKPHK